MPVENGNGIDASLPGGALRLDVDPSEASGGVTTGADGVLVRGQYGAECVMTGKLSGGVYLVAGSSIAYNSIPFGAVEVDYSEFVSVPQCDSTNGVLTAWTPGLWEVGCSVLLQETGAAASAHFQLAIWTDFGNADLALQPATVFGTGNGAFGAAWQRIAQRTQELIITTVGNPTIPDCPGLPITCATVWCVQPPTSAPAITFNSSTPAPTRFRFGFRSDTTYGLVANNSNHARGWMRWLGPPA